LVDEEKKTRKTRKNRKTGGRKTKKNNWIRIKHCS
jgi:hypothetical protein